MITLVAKHTIAAVTAHLRDLAVSLPKDAFKLFANKRSEPLSPKAVNHRCGGCVVEIVNTMDAARRRASASSKEEEEMSFPIIVANTSMHATVFMTNPELNAGFSRSFQE